MATTSINDDLDGSSIDAGLGVEDVASSVFFLLMLKSQDLGDNKSGARILITKDLIIFILIHSPVHGHLLKGFHFLVTHGVIGAIVVEDHGALVCALEGLVASASACETFDELVFMVSSAGVDDDEAFGLKLLVDRGEGVLIF